jgi:hypothetical protein
MKGMTISHTCRDEASSTYEGEKRHTRGFVEKPEGKRPLGRPRYRRKIILRWIFKKWDEGV